MLSAIQIKEQQAIITCDLLSVDRPGMNMLVQWLVENGFFTSPASTKYHGCYEGGLAKHSLGVKFELDNFQSRFQLECEPAALIVAPLLHDICKVGAYQPVKTVPSKQKYSWNRCQPPGHALLSLVRIIEFISLTDLEEAMIKYHMGIYGSIECMTQKGEYPMRPDGMFKAWNRHPIVKFMYFADETAAAQERVEENIKY